MAVDAIAPGEHLLTFINQIVAEQNYETGDTNVIVVPLSSLEDYPQFKFKIKISHEGRDDLYLFVKVTELDHNKWDNLSLKPYEKERLFYSSLMKAYRQLEDKHGVPETDRLRLPLCYGAEAAHKREILVLEDLTSKGFGLANRFESVCWPYAAAAVTELAKFHALSMAFKHESPEEFEKITTQLPEGVFENNVETVGLLESLKSLALETVRNENRKKLKTFFKNQVLVTSYNELLKPLHCKVIVHAHFWPKNMMHKVLNDGTVEVIPVDYQTIQVGSPVTDLFHFIFTASDAQFRANHYGELIQLYCTELIHAVGRLGLDIEQEYPSSALESEMIEKLPFGLFAAVAYLPVLALDDRAESAGGLAGDPDAHGFAAAQLYCQRMNQVVDAYKDAGILEESQQTRSRKRCGMCFLC